ncbi:MAG: polyprenyl synthetase family protein [Planctomycetota bacterium]
MEAEAQPNQFTNAELIERVDETLGEVIRGVGQPSLTEAIEYSVFSGGKRIRPVLCLRSCQAVGGEIESALRPAAAIELIHTFSLVHDDLPAMDDDDLRRGRPTLHKHTSEAMAILAGDAMVALAFQTLADRRPEFAHIAGEMAWWLAGMTKTMIIGQVHDTTGGWPEKMSDQDRLYHTHRQKTGALIYGAIRMGATAGGASKDQLDALSVYSGAIGLMFQAVDDLLDVTQTAEKMGKATGKDAEQGKLTYPGLLGIDGTRAEIDKLLMQALDALSGFDTKADPLREMAKNLATREK